MKFIRTNKYNSLNIFNYFVIILFVTIAIHFFSAFTTFVAIPYIIVICTILLINYCTVEKKKTNNNKNNVFQKTITFICISFYLLVIIFSLYLFIINTSSSHIYKNPRKYSQAIKAIKQQEKISHFPKTIPTDAEKIQMYCYTSDYDGEIFLLKFYINKEYIKQELKQHKFLNSDTLIGTYQDIYYIYTDNNRISIDNTTWYVIDDKENKQIYPKYFPYYSGIGISNELNYIIYYYIEPSD